MKEDCVLLEKLRKLQRVVHVLCALCALGFKRTDKYGGLNGTLHSAQFQYGYCIDITTYRIRIGRFGPGRGYIWTRIAEIYSSSIIGSDIHYRMLATIVLLTFILKSCVMTQQEGIVQDVYTFVGTDQCHLAHIAIYVNLHTRIRAVRPSTCFGLV